MSNPRCYDGATPWTRSRLKTVRANGGTAVSVYIVGSPGGMRCANKADVDLARSMGLGVLPNWERAADFFAHCDLQTAQAAGVEALAACRSLGFPDDGSVDVAFSFDFEIPPDQYRSMADKLWAASRGMGGHYRAVAYGQFGFIDYLANHGQPGPHWLMGSTFRRSSQFYVSEVGSPHVSMVQSHDASGNWLTSPVSGTDVNTITQPQQLRAWWPENSPNAQGAGMTMDKDVAAAFAAINARLDALPAQTADATWGKEFVNPEDPQKRSWNAASWLISANLRAGKAWSAATLVAKGAAIDTAAVAADIKNRLIALLGGQS